MRFGLLLIIVAAFLIALNPTVLVENFLRLLPPPRRPAARDVMSRIRLAWLGWMAAVADRRTVSAPAGGSRSGQARTNGRGAR